MTKLSKAAFFFICLAIIVTTMLYGTVHQPTIALFYLFIGVLLILWAADSWLSGSLRYSRSMFQVPLFAFAVYAFVQIIRLVRLRIRRVFRTFPARSLSNRSRRR